VYRLTAAFPKVEIYGLTSQVRRSMVSVPGNIAEGFRKRGLLDKARYMNIAEASLEESRYYMILGRDLGYHQDETILPEIEELLGNITDNFFEVHGTNEMLDAVQNAIALTGAPAAKHHAALFAKLRDAVNDAVVLYGRYLAAVKA
jgi:four helix bundle protein